MYIKIHFDAPFFYVQLLKKLLQQNSNSLPLTSFPLKSLMFKYQTNSSATQKVNIQFFFLFLKLLRVISYSYTLLIIEEKNTS